MFEIALVDCKVLGIVRTLCMKGNRVPAKSDPILATSHLTFDLTGGVLRGEIPCAGVDPSCLLESLAAGLLHMASFECLPKRRDWVGVQCTAPQLV